MTVLEIRPHPWGWKVFESPGVEPVFQVKARGVHEDDRKTAAGDGGSRRDDIGPV
jgi:hypothetical protein